MGAVRAMVNDGGPNPRQSLPIDLLMGGESITAGAIATVGTGVLSGAAIATGIIRRTGSTAGYADVFDSAANILAALQSNNSIDADVVQGSSFRLLVINTVAFADTVAASTDGTTVLGTGVTAIAASTWREYLVTILSSCKPSVQQMVVDGSTAVLTFTQNSSGFAVRDMGPTNNLPRAGAAVSGTGIPANATVLNVNLTQGGAAGVTISANTTAASGANGTPVTFGPRVQIDGLMSGPL
jgi:hypothetical protein